MGCGKSKQEDTGPVQEVSNAIPERKIILIGSSGVGKTAIIHTFAQNKLQQVEGLAPTPGVKN